MIRSSESSLIESSFNASESLPAFEQGDLRDANFLNKVFSQYAIQAVYHFAASSLVGESVIHPLKYYDNNVVGTLRLLEAMREHQVKKIVFSSTAAVYGEPDIVPISEQQCKQPSNTYGQTKLAV